MEYESNTTLFTLIQLRRDTAANWASANPILAQGEPGFELDTLKMKIGDGNTVWSSLDYQSSIAAINVPANGEVLAYKDGEFEWIDPASLGAISLIGITPENGSISGGIEVSIFGGNFNTVIPAVVKFGGIEATSVTVVSNTEITCVTPAGDTAGPVDIEVHQGNAPATLLGVFEYSQTLWTPVNIVTRFWASADHTDPFEDRSGNGNPLVGQNGNSLPSILSSEQNGLDVWSFNGTSQLAGTLAGVDLSDHRLFFVYRDVVDTYISRQRSPFTSTRLYISKSNIVFGGTNVSASDPNWLSNQWGLVESEAIGTAKRTIINGGAAIGTGTDSNTQIHAELHVGGGENHLDVPSQLDCAEVISVSPGSLDAATMEKIQGYLAHKWGIDDKLPSGHVYKSAPP